MKQRIGRLARLLADRWAPERIRVVPDPATGGHTITVDGAVLAKIGPGMVRR